MQPQRGGLEEGGKDYRHPCISQEKQHPHTFHDNGASFIVAFLLPVLTKCADGSIEVKSFIADGFFLYRNRLYMTELVVVLKWLTFTG